MNLFFTRSFVTQGSISTTAKQVVLNLRKAGKKIGLLRLRVIRPFPWEQIETALWHLKGVAVIDKNVSPGIGGIMYPEIKAALYEMPEQPVVSNFITGLGGNKVDLKKYYEIFEQLEKDEKASKGSIKFV